MEDGTSKIFLNMTSKNGRPELISLLQYMKHTTLDNENIIVKDKRILDLDRIVGKVKQSEEWEAVEMNIYEIGVARGEELGEKRGEERGIEKGIETGTAQTLIKNIDSAMKNLGIDLQHACEALGTSIKEYENAKQTLALMKDAPTTTNNTDDTGNEI